MAAYSIGPLVKSLSQRLTIGPLSPAYSLLRQDEREQIDGILEDLKGVKNTWKLIEARLADEDEWREVLESSLLDFEEVREAKLILGSLYLSYLYLSPKLKSCFKHCAIYPNNMVENRRLKLSWMACDLVKDWNEASKCLGELASRSFLEFEPSDYSTIRMHDHIYDLAQFVLEEKHRYLDYDGTSAECPIEFDISDCRHASLNLQGISRVAVNITHSNLRTLNISSKYERSGHYRHKYGALTVHLSRGQCVRELNMDIYNSVELTSDEGCRNYFKCLRILTIGRSWSYIPRWVSQLYNLRYLQLFGVQIEYLPDNVCDLVNLRWLNLKFSTLKYLPESISRLVNLQELNLVGCPHLVELPESIISLTKLTILNLLGTPVSFMPKGFGALTNLQNLTDFIVDPTQAGIAELKNMKHLEGAILIDNLCEVVSEEDAARADLASKKGLRELHLRWHKNGLFKDDHLLAVRTFNARLPHEKFLLEKGNEEKIAHHEERVFEQLRPHHNIEKILIRMYEGFKLPSWMGDAYFTKLTSIDIVGIHYCTSLSPIDQLSSLATLTLESMDGLEELVPRLSIEPVDINIIHPTTEKRLCFPKLRSLSIDGCNSLELLPLYKFASLEYVNVRRCLNLK